MSGAILRGLRNPINTVISSKNQRFYKSLCYTSTASSGTIRKNSFERNLKKAFGLNIFARKSSWNKVKEGFMREQIHDRFEA